MSGRFRPIVAFRHHHHAVVRATALFNQRNFLLHTERHDSLQLKCCHSDVYCETRATYMPDYDFKTLNDKEFEVLCTDLVGKELGRRFERFKPGKDAGVDGRYFESDGTEVILQCKHWANTPLPKLINYLKNEERPKLDKLKPHRYILTVSNQISRLEKQKIRSALSPHIIRDDDIFGKEDLNHLLGKFPECERNSYKLWLHSSSVLSFIAQSGIMGRSEFSLDEIVQKSARYAVTERHEQAIQLLEKLGVIIISGDPGVGKTTLAEHLCLHYVSNGFEFVTIADEISEAEAVFSRETKQVFYFDDFLGRNYLEALRGHEGGHLTAFIKRVSKNKAKRFVLTSRSTILNQGKFLIDAFDHSNLQRNEFELRIKSLTTIDKARILYNHIWHSGLPDEFRDEFYKDRRYRVIIDQKNFNPRVISYITDPARRESDRVSDYWSYVLRSLTDPSKVWEHPFNVQLDHAQRAIVLLVVLNRKGYNEAELSIAYHRLVSRPGNQHLRGAHDFLSYSRLLTGSFLSRIFSSSMDVSYDLFNPSIGDYVLRRYAKDAAMLCDSILSMRSENSIVTLMNIKGSKLIDEGMVKSICSKALSEVVSDHFKEYNIAYITILCFQLITVESQVGQLTEAVRFLLSGGGVSDSSYLMFVVKAALQMDLISAEAAAEFLLKNVEDLIEDDDIVETVAILSLVDRDKRHDEIAERLHARVIAIASDRLGDFIDITDAFSGLGPDDDDQAERNLIDMVTGRFSDLGLEIDRDDAWNIVNSIDVSGQLEQYIGESYVDEERDYSHVRSSGPDEVDDLFDRG